MSDNLTFFGMLLLSFFGGSIPFSLIVTGLKGVNLREVGSGNLGATNVGRALGLGWGIFVFLLDAVKGFVPTFLAIQMFDSAWLHIIVGFAAVLGHSFSPFAKFKGGKGGATGIGVLLALNSTVCAIIVLIAVTLIMTTRYVAPATMICAALTPVLLYFFGAAREYSLVTGLIAVFIIYRHKANIFRLLKGEENKI